MNPLQICVQACPVSFHKTLVIDFRLKITNFNRRALSKVPKYCRTRRISLQNCRFFFRTAASFTKCKTAVQSNWSLFGGNYILDKGNDKSKLDAKLREIQTLLYWILYLYLLVLLMILTTWNRARNPLMTLSKLTFEFIHLYSSGYFKHSVLFGTISAGTRSPLSMNTHL